MTSPRPAHPLFSATAQGDLLDPHGAGRAVVVELQAPADAGALTQLWRRIQTDLGWPAPAVAVSGSGLQVWVALAEARPAAELAAAGRQLRERFLADLPEHACPIWPNAGVPAAWPGACLPGHGDDEERWSAFVAPDLAPLFAETPWLDVPPSAEGQAALLAGLSPVSREAWQALVAPQPPAPGAPARQAAGAGVAREASTQGTPQEEPQDPPRTVPGGEGPRRFLERVMDDPAVPLALRIEAAKALLQAGSA